MAVSELIGSRCPNCKRKWRTLKDVKRIHSFAAPYTTLQKSMTVAVYWSVHCRRCGKVVEIVYMADDE